jgi:hypothetical protein
MLSCREVTELLSQAQERPLGFFEHAGVRLHLLICRGCTNFRRQLDFIRMAIRRRRDDGDAT